MNNNYITWLKTLIGKEVRVESSNVEKYSKIGKEDPFTEGYIGVLSEVNSEYITLTCNNSDLFDIRVNDIICIYGNKNDVGGQQIW